MTWRHVAHPHIAPNKSPLLFGAKLSSEVGDVVFTNGRVADGDQLTVYCGASNTVVCGARFFIREILDTFSHGSPLAHGIHFSSPLRSRHANDANRANLPPVDIIRDIRPICGRKEGATHNAPPRNLGDRANFALFPRTAGCYDCGSRIGAWQIPAVKQP